MIMKKINYNIATKKRMQPGRFIFLTALVWALGILFFGVGLNLISSKNKQGREEAKELSILRDKLSDVSEKTGEYHKKIDYLKRGWNRRIVFSNSLITRKSFSFVALLNMMEDRLPPDMFMSALSISSDSKIPIIADVLATSFKKMGEFYHQFPPRDLIIKKESLEANNLVSASISIGLADEKK